MRHRLALGLLLVVAGLASSCTLQHCWQGATSGSAAGTFSLASAGFQPSPLCETLR